MPNFSTQRSSWQLVASSWYNSGYAAVGFLKTLPPNRASASAQGSLPRRELHTGLRDGNGFYAQDVYIDSEYTHQNPSVCSADISL